MDRKKIFKAAKQEICSFFGAVSSSNETAYLILFTLYIAIYVELKIVFQGSRINTFVERTRYAALGIVMWGMALYLFFIIAAWKNLWKDTFWLILIGGLLLFFVWFFSGKMSTNAYGVVFDLVFCLTACGKSFRKMLMCILGTVTAGLIIAGIGIPMGYTADLGKPETATPGHSLGINYPNTWAYMVFLALIIFWYLFLRFKPVLTCIAFWPVSVFMYQYINCRTIAAITIVFPVIAFAVMLLEKRADRKAERGSIRQSKVLSRVIILIPFIAFAIMMFSSMQVDWWYKYYHGPLRNLAWRFIQGGLYFRTYGLPIVGNPYRANEHTYVNVQGEFIKVGILDSSFAAYLIMRGVLWMTYTLLWLCLAYRKALKKRDYAIIMLETILLAFAMMERPGLEVWFNFILLYPLAKVISKPGTEPVLECAGETKKNAAETAEESEAVTASVDRVEAVMDPGQEAGGRIITDSCAEIVSDEKDKSSTEQTQETDGLRTESVEENPQT